MSAARNDGKEVELKWRVSSEKELKQVADIALKRIDLEQTPKPVRQNNTFFDTADGDLKKNGVILRLRQEDESYVLTAKTSIVADDQGSKALAVRLEEEIDVPAPDAAMFLEGQASPILFFRKAAYPTDALAQKQRLLMVGRLAKAGGKKTLVALGSFVNYRQKIPFMVDNHRLVLEFDTATFPGDQTHYEVELEVPIHLEPQVAEERLLGLFEEAKVQGRSAPGKANRFFRALAGQQL